MTTAGTSGQSAADSEIIAQLDGGWRLVKIEQPDAKGAVKTARVNGLLVFTRDGHMAVQVRNLEPGHVDSAYSRGGYEASFGKITLDSANSIFLYRVEGALVHELVGQDFPRAYSFVNDQLILTSTRDDEKWRVIWRRG
ncbi:hypothetical protein FHT80_003035 [Rhizobium sp. BK226]|uniref:lipocalin-like domain-containing protein n=1 Tax=Rhizobium TaxID=379 RepID=UPI000BE87D19|nr:MULTISPECIES: lipocalin-like domain-containing protein [Rhizobium]MBB4113709.1 hypothetical protein [Rhizobium sp. BK226]PDS57557.1 hypothetical protein CO663_19930 [Rhizobium anhuiense]UTS89019.1 lipocalin-like domain-containing protein [Rhizobium anhuiense bv. trifolii]